MSKTIVIPTDRGSRVRVVVNHKVYEYAAGTTQTVPDEVAELLENSAAEAPVPGRRAVAPLEAPKRDTSGTGAPVRTDDNGNLYVEKNATAYGIYVDEHKVIVPEEPIVPEG